MKAFPRFVALALTLLLAGGVAPSTALAAEVGGLAAASAPPTTQAAKSYGLWVGGVEVTSTNASNISGGGISGKAYYDAESNTLTLNGATITGSNSIIDSGSFSNAQKYGIYCPNGTLTVKLTGSNKVTVGETPSLGSGFEDVCGIRASKLQFTGDGSLSVTSKVGRSSSAVSRSSYGIWVFGNMTVGPDATVSVASRLMNASNNSGKCYGVQADGLSVKGTLSASSSSNKDDAIAVYATWKGGVNVAKGGKLTASADGVQSPCAIHIGESDATLAVGGSVRAESSCEGGTGVAGRIRVDTTGEIEALGGSRALSDASLLELASAKSKVTAGSSAASAKATAAAKVGTALYVHVSPQKVLAKKTNPMTVKAKIVAFKYAKVKKKAQAVKASKAFTVKKAKGKVTYKVTKYVTKAAKGKVKVAGNGKVTVRKGTPKKAYKLKVKVTAAGNASYKAKSKTVTLVVKVK